MMNPRLRDEDRLAVDLLLDNAMNGARRGDGQASFAPVSAGVRERVPAVQKLLTALEMLPTEEPPADLVARTMRRIGADAAHGPNALRPPQPAVTGMHVPHA